jgi:hypothetical protein
MKTNIVTNPLESESKIGCQFFSLSYLQETPCIFLQGTIDSPYILLRRIVHPMALNYEA